MYGDLFASFTQGFSEDHLATLQCDYIEALMQSCLVSIRQHCNVTFLQPFYKVFREAYGNVARKPVCNTNAKLQKGFPAWLPLSLYAMKMQPYGKKLQPFRNLNFPLGSLLLSTYLQNFIEIRKETKSLALGNITFLQQKSVTRNGWSLMRISI